MEVSSKRNSAKIDASTRIHKVSKAILISSIILLVAFVPFVAGNPEQVSNAYAPGPHLAQITSSESDMPVYVANASNPYSSFQYTGAELSLQDVSGSGGGHEIYAYLEINSSTSNQISTSGIVRKSTFTLPASANNAYWYVTNGGAKNYGTVGADLSSNGQDATLDQFINVNYKGALGQESNSSLANCRTTGIDGYPPSVDTGGEERWGLIFAITNPAESVTYEITGGMVLTMSNGQTVVIILVNPVQITSLQISSYCSIPSVSFSSDVIDWTIRAPPPTSTVPGNYQMYPTIGGKLEKSSGTTSMIGLQYVSPDGTTTTSSTTASTTSTTQSNDTSTSTGSSTTSSSESSTSSTTSSTTSQTSSTTTTSSSSTSTSSSTTSNPSTSTVTSTTSTSTTTCTTSESCTGNPYWNPNSQEVATYVPDNLFNPQVGLISTSSLQGCTDYVGGLPCHDTFWTTSDNVPTGWTLQDFGYQSDTQAIIKECSYLQCEGANSGDRYEAYIGWPIATGSPGDIHAIFSPGSDTLAITCSTSGCGDGVPAYGTLSGGTPYKIQADVWTGSAGNPSPDGPVDVVGPQAINYYLHGDMTDSLKYANALVDQWNGYSVDGSGGGDVWHLGQVMFVMRVLGMDTSTNLTTTAYGTETYAQVFSQMENELWAIQAAYNCNGGCLPNSYTQTSPGGAITGTSGADAENQDAGLLPFSYTVVSMVRSEFGAYSTSGSPSKYIHENTTTKSAGLSSVVFISAVLASTFGSTVAVLSPRWRYSVTQKLSGPLTSILHSFRLSPT